MFPKDRPKILIQKDNFDQIIDNIGWMALIFLVVIPLYYYGQLPEKIPTHFNAQGDADSYSHKNMIWLFPVLGSIFFILQRKLIQLPHILNYPVKITAENAKAHYTNASKMLRIINTLTTSIFAYLTFGIIMIALKKMTSIGPTIYVLVALIIIAAIVFLVRSFKIK